jgi:predicted nucleic acid-binding protein
LVYVAIPVRELKDLSVKRSDGYWQRAGALRAKLFAKQRKAALADVLIAQSCIDNEIVLVTRDTDFHSLAKVSALKLIAER